MHFGGNFDIITPMKERLQKILSGAGHDAMIMGSLCDVAMIFVPSKDGRSHVPEEWTDYEDLRKGAEVLCRCVRELASK